MSTTTMWFYCSLLVLCFCNTAPSPIPVTSAAISSTLLICGGTVSYLILRSIWTTRSNLLGTSLYKNLFWSHEALLATLCPSAQEVGLWNILAPTPLLPGDWPLPHSNMMSLPPLLARNSPHFSLPNHLTVAHASRNFLVRVLSMTGMISNNPVFLARFAPFAWRLASEPPNNERSHHVGIYWEHCFNSYGCQTTPIC